MRKFVAKNSKGLRIRSGPSLQSEQIGVLAVNDIIAFTDEVSLLAMYCLSSHWTMFSI